MSDNSKRMKALRAKIPQGKEIFARPAATRGGKNDQANWKGCLSRSVDVVSQRSRHGASSAWGEARSQISQIAAKLDWSLLQLF